MRKRPHLLGFLAHYFILMQEAHCKRNDIMPSVRVAYFSAMFPGGPVEPASDFVADNSSKIQRMLT